MMKIYASILDSTRSRRLMDAICSLICLFIFLICNFTLAGAATANSESEEYWRAFRSQNPLFIQDVVLSSPLENGGRLLLLSEPPPLLYGSVAETLNAVFGDAYKGHDIFTEKVGFDGWVKDIVVRLAYPKGTNRRLERDIAALHQILFGTDYKAGYRLFDIKPWTQALTLKRKIGAPPDLMVSANSIHNWFFENPISLLERTAGMRGFRSRSDTAVTLEEAFGSARTGVYYSVEPGLVVLLIDRGSKLNASKAYLRQFFLDTDAIVGAIGLVKTRSKIFAIIGRERDTAISAMPPLRVETVLTLAATDEENLAQSYERFLPLADKTTDPELVRFVGVRKGSAAGSFPSELTNPGAMNVPKAKVEDRRLSRLGPRKVDWAPILLSHDLMHTEYGNLLNVTDQILKGWSEPTVRYGNFPYPRPFDYPYVEGVMAKFRTQ